MTLLSNYDLTMVTTFHVPAHARYYADYASLDELLALLAMPQLQGLPVLHMGGGSNLLFTRDFPGVVLHSAIKGITLAAGNEGDAPGAGTVLATAAAGEVWDDFVAAACRAGYCGIENLSLIPGSVGAAAVQNIGAYGVELSDCLHSVAVYDTKLQRPLTLLPSQLNYGYRQSLFKEPDYANRYVVTAVTVRLSTDSSFKLDYGPLRQLANQPGLTAESVRQRVMAIRRSKLPDPDQIGSAGSFFKNPVVDGEKYHALLTAYPDLPGYHLADGRIKLPAGWLIEQAGLSGATVGGAMVYPRQCLVIVNTGRATGADVAALAQKVQQTVMQRFGLQLHPEVIFI